MIKFSRETEWLAESQPEREGSAAVRPRAGEDPTRGFRRKRGLPFRKREPRPGIEQQGVLSPRRHRSIERGEASDIDESRLAAIQGDERPREGHRQGSRGRRCEGRGGQ